MSLSLTRPKMAPERIITLGAFFLCFWGAIYDLVRSWFTIPDAEHGLLIAPIAIWLAWRDGVAKHTNPAPKWGATIIALGIVLYILGRAGGVATVPRVALVIGLVGLTMWYGGWRQIVHWWLPFALLILTIPVPETIISAITLPLQGIAASMGAEMLSWRSIPVMLSGNIIHLPGQMLFVSEACSGLRSLTALISLALLAGALFLKYPLTRVFLLGLSVVVAIMINGFRVFLTGFLVYFIDPALGEGFMHLTEGYLLFIVSFLILAAITWGCMKLELVVVSKTESVST